MTGMVIGVLRALLVVLFVGCVAVQVAAGSLAALMAGGAPGVLLTVLLVASALCVQVVMLAVWMLAGMVRAGSIFDSRRRADVWVDLAIGALGVAAVLAAGCFVFFLIGQLVSPSPSTVGLAIATAAAAGVAAALALLVAVMRRLLHTAIDYQSELAEVI